MRLTHAKELKNRVESAAKEWKGVHELPAKELHSQRARTSETPNARTGPGQTERRRGGW